MLIVYDLATGDVLDNTGTSSAMPDGPPDDVALANVPEDVHHRARLLRINDDDEPDLVASILTNRHHVDPRTGQVVIDGPHPEPDPADEPVTVEDRVAALASLAGIDPAELEESASARARKRAEDRRSAR